MGPQRNPLQGTEDSAKQGPSQGWRIVPMVLLGASTEFCAVHSPFHKSFKVATNLRMGLVVGGKGKSMRRRSSVVHPQAPWAP